MQETQTQQFRLTQRLTPHLVADELFELSGRIERRMRVFGVLHTVNLVQPTNRDLYEMAYAMQQLLQLLEDQEPRLRQDMEIQKQKARDSEARAVKYQKEAFAMQCRVEELEKQVQELREKHRQKTHIESSQVSQAEFNEDVYRMKLRKEQRELERVKALAVKNGTAVHSRNMDYASNQSCQNQQICANDVQNSSLSVPCNYEPENSVRATVVQSSLEPEPILRESRIATSKSPQMNKSVSFRDEAAEREAYQPRNQMDVVKSTELQRAIYFDKPRSEAEEQGEALTVDELQEQTENDVVHIPSYAPIQVNPVRPTFGASLPLDFGQAPQNERFASNTGRFGEESPPGRTPEAFNIGSASELPASVLESSTLEPPATLEQEYEPFVPSFEVEMQAGKPNPIASLYHSNSRTGEPPVEGKPGEPKNEEVLYKTAPSQTNSTTYLPYAEINGIGPAEEFAPSAGQLSVQLSGLPNKPANSSNSVMQSQFTFPTIPVTVISSSPGFEDPRLKIDYKEMYDEEKGIEREYCQIAQERRMIDAARSQVISEEERVNRQRQRVEQAVDRLESSGIDVKSLVGELLT